jgi:hypothetical protein
MPCSSLPTVRKTLGWGIKSWQAMHVTPRSWMPALYVFSPAVADADFYSHFYPHQNLDVSVARWSLKEKKPSVYWAFQGIHSAY